MRTREDYSRKGEPSHAGSWGHGMSVDLNLDDMKNHWKVLEGESII